MDHAGGQWSTRGSADDQSEGVSDFIDMGTYEIEAPSTARQLIMFSYAPRYSWNMSKPPGLKARRRSSLICAPRQPSNRCRLVVVRASANAKSNESLQPLQCVGQLREVGYHPFKEVLVWLSVRNLPKESYAQPEAFPRQFCASAVPLLSVFLPVLSCG